MSRATDSFEVARSLRPFRNAAYRPLAVALVLTTFAGGAWIVALVWEIIRLGGGPTAVSVVSTANAVGMLVPALFAGVVADRIPQRSILLAVHATEATALGCVALLAWQGHTTLTLLALAALFTGIAMSFYYPAYTALLPALVDEEDLLAVNGFESAIRPAIGQALGPGVAGMAVAAAAPSLAFTIAAGACLLGIVAVANVPRTAVRRSELPAHPMEGVFTDLAEGWRYMVATPWFLGTLLSFAIMLLLFLGPLEVLVPFLLKDELGGGPRAHSWVLGAFGIGTMIGSLIVGSLRLPRRYLTWMNLGWAMACIPFAFIGFATAVWMVVAVAVFMGVAEGVAGVIWGTLLQRKVPPALLGRVASLDFTVSISLLPVSMALAGPMAEWIGLAETFLIAGLAPTPIAIIALLWARMPEHELAHPMT